MTITTATFRNRVAEDLGIKAQDQDLSDEEAAKIDARIDSISAHYRELGLIWWADDAIPDAAEEGYAKIVCALVCASVRKSKQGFEEMLPLGLSMLAGIKPAAKLETVRTEYY